MSRDVVKMRPVSYSYFPIAAQKQIEQVKSYGNRISILGVWQPDLSFDYALVQGSFNKERYVRHHELDCPKE